MDSGSTFFSSVSTSHILTLNGSQVEKATSHLSHNWQWNLNTSAVCSPESRDKLMDSLSSFLRWSCVKKTSVIVWCFEIKRHPEPTETQTEREISVQILYYDNQLTSCKRFIIINQCDGRWLKLTYSVSETQATWQTTYFPSKYFFTIWINNRCHPVLTYYFLITVLGLSHSIVLSLLAKSILTQND